MSQYIDLNGYPGCLRSDGVLDMGDTAAILGTLWFFNRSQGFALPFDNKTSCPLRHPDSSQWWGKPDRFSRDQLIAVLCGLIGRKASFQKSGAIARDFFNQKWDTEKLLKSHARKGFVLAWNTRRNGLIEAEKKFPDICGPEVWALWLRLLFQGTWLGSALLPLLTILDIEHLVSAIHWRLFRKDRVTRNHMLASLACSQVLRTPISALAFYINDWEDLIARWEAHCAATGEYPTSNLFKEHLKL